MPHNGRNQHADELRHREQGHHQDDQSQQTNRLHGVLPSSHTGGGVGNPRSYLL